MHMYRGTVCLAAATLSIMGYSWGATKPSADQSTTSNSPIAYIYVANTPQDSSTNEILGYSAAPDGRLTPLASSPFMEDVNSMAVDGKHMVAASRLTPQANVYAIQDDGALTFTSSTDFGQYNSSSDCGDAGQLFFDHTGASLYIQEFNGSDSCTNTVVASFTLNKSAGTLDYLGTDETGVFPGDSMAARFTGNNLFAYDAVNSGCMYYDIYGFARASDGTLTSLDFTYNLPTPPADASRYVPSFAAADPTNHVAFLEQPANPPGCAAGPLQLATYTVDSQGNLTTTSSHMNMPTTKIVNATDMKMSPSGNLLAVAGQEGLQVFHFNGADPITGFTSLLTTDPINQMFWDNNNHLYAISQSAGELFVFTVTTTGAEQALGSPYAITSPDDIAVQPYPLP